MTEGADLPRIQPSTNPVAPVWHTPVLLAIFAAITVMGGIAQRKAHAPATSPRLLPLQIQAIVFEWFTLGWVWFGVRRRGVCVRELVAGRWPDAWAILIDLALGAGLWGSGLALPRRWASCSTPAARQTRFRIPAIGSKGYWPCALRLRRASARRSSFVAISTGSFTR